MFVRWLTRYAGRDPGTVEENDDDVCREWLSAGWVEESSLVDWERQHGTRGEVAEVERSVDEPPRDRAMKRGNARKK